MDVSKAGIKVAPSKVFCDPSQNVAYSKHSVALEALEAQMGEKTKVKLNLLNTWLRDTTWMILFM